MSAGRIIAIVVVALMFIGLIVLFKGDNTPAINWEERYDTHGKEPYDTYVIGKMLEDYFPQHDHKVLKKPLRKSLTYKAKGNYVGIARNFYWTDEDADSLIAFVERGNKAFVASNQLPATLVRRLAFRFNVDYFYEFNEMYYPTLYLDSLATVFVGSVPRSKLKLKKVFNNFVIPNSWNVMPTVFEKFPEVENIGFTEIPYGDSVYFNYTKFKVGKGELLMHCIPLAFTNYNQITKEGKEYSEQVFSYLNNDDIYWDEISQYELNDFETPEKSPLSFVLAQRSLRWAWYLCLALVLVFILFRAKRKQKVIPVIEPNINTSIMFIETIGKLYYMQNNHRKVALYKMKHFQYFVRKKYQINIAKNEALKIQLLADASGLTLEHINKIIEKHILISAAHSITKEQLMEFYSLIQQFYNKCK